MSFSFFPFFYINNLLNILIKGSGGAAKCPVTKSCPVAETYLFYCNKSVTVFHKNCFLGFRRGAAKDTEKRGIHPHTEIILTISYKLLTD